MQRWKRAGQTGRAESRDCEKPRAGMSPLHQEPSNRLDERRVNLYCNCLFAKTTRLNGRMMRQSLRHLRDIPRPCRDNRRAFIDGLRNNFVKGISLAVMRLAVAGNTRQREECWDAVIHEWHVIGRAIVTRVHGVHAEDL